MNQAITSPANPKIKWVQKLHKNSFRRTENVFLVEGVKEIANALDNGYEPHSLFVCTEMYGSELPAQYSDIYSITKLCYEKISYRTNSDGIIAVFHSKQRRLDELTFGDNPLFLIIEGVEKPGNLGAVIRSADGANVDAVIVCNQRTDIFNPNVIRSSVGTVFSTQVVAATNQEVVEFLQKHEVKPYGAALTKDAIPYTKARLDTPVALILGTEHSGLSDFWLRRSTHIVIPMLGINDSLNLSNAAAILAYEAVRQRHEY